MKKYFKLTTLTLVLTLLSCASSETASNNNQTGSSVTLLTHDSFTVSDGIFDSFTSETGISVEQLALGDTGQLISAAILTKEDPLGDVIFGIDNTFLGRAVNAEILETYESPNKNQIRDHFDHDQSPYLTPIDFGHVCVNYWKDYFTESLPPPNNFHDLIDPAYSNLLVVQNPETSSPGLAFLIATISHFGENWLNFWEKLDENNVSVTSDWESSYYGEFIAGDGQKPLVVSYASSPIAELIFSDPESGIPPTGIIEDTCFKQVEYAGILRGTKKRTEAEALIDFLLSNTFQEDIPFNMFMMPVSSEAELPDEFTDYPEIQTGFSLSAFEIDERRNIWTDLWTEKILR